jgi:hypothetical protein
VGDEADAAGPAVGLVASPAHVPDADPAMPPPSKTALEPDDDPTVPDIPALDTAVPRNGC